MDFVPDRFFHLILGPGSVNDFHPVRLRLGNFQISKPNFFKKSSESRSILSC